MARWCRATHHGAARLTRPQPWRGGQSGSKRNKALLLCHRVGLMNRSTGRLSARDNQYTSSAILTCTRPKFIASSTIPLFDISSASHNYDTSSSIHKFDITRHTTCSISIWVSEYKCILKNSYDPGVYGDRRRRCLFGCEGSTLGVNPTSIRPH